jgi:hypothetical protein
MIYRDTPEKEYDIVECPKCFYRWEKVIDKGRLENCYELCDYCFNHSEMTELDLLKRKLEVMEYTTLSRTPILLQDMFNFILARLDKIEQEI